MLFPSGPVSENKRLSLMFLKSLPKTYDHHTENCCLDQIIQALRASVGALPASHFKALTTCKSALSRSENPSSSRFQTLVDKFLLHGPWSEIHVD